VSVKDLIQYIEKNKLSVAANGTFFRTDKKSVLSTILSKWFEERVIYKNEMKKAYQTGNKEKGEYYYLMQYTMKILLNSLYGATALPSFRYGAPMSTLSEAITLSGWRIIQESALVANTHMNKVLRNEIKLKL
jgi:DNA polymerase elongation subunit (family B)